MVQLNKKAFSEITSFGLITMLIIVSSIVSYLFSTNMLNENLIYLDLNSMKSNFKVIDYKFSEISQFNGTSFSLSLNFNKGLLVFEDNLLKYLSLSEYGGDEYCDGRVCYNASGGYEVNYIVLPTGYVFSENVTLTPGNYFLRFKNIKDEKKIKLYLQ